MLPWRSNLEADWQTFRYYEWTLSKQHLYQVRAILLPWFWRNCYLKKSYFELPLSKQHLHEIRVILLQWFWRSYYANQTKWSMVIKHINWVDNHQMIIAAKYGSHHFTGYEEKQFNNFPIISLWELSVAKATKPRDRLANFSLF